MNQIVICPADIPKIPALIPIELMTSIDISHFSSDLSPILTRLLMMIYFGYVRYSSHNADQTEASILILAPQVNDFYF